MRFLEISDMDCYVRSLRLSNYIWNIVIFWKYFEKHSVGMQLVRAADSISANIAEGFGRYGKKDKIKFYYYSHGSIKEVRDWVIKCGMRGLLTPEQHAHILKEIQLLPKEVNQLILFTNKRLKV